SPDLLEASGIGPVFVVASGEKQIEIAVAGPPSTALSLGPLPVRKQGVKVFAGRGNLPEYPIPRKANAVAVRTPGDVRNRALACGQFLVARPVNFHGIETFVRAGIRDGGCVR